jgi:hypothetical protein
MTGVRATHDATCPEISPVDCEAQDIPDHIHDQSLTLLRMEPRFSAGLGKGFLLSLAVPLDIKLAQIRYTLMDDTDYVPTYGGLHHRNEDLVGIGDIRLQLGAYRMIVGTPVIIGARIGVVLPTGKTEDNPFTAASQSQQHQHLQFGGGTVDPTAGLELIIRGKKVGSSGLAIGMIGNINGRFPLYENPRGYRGPISINAALGPMFRLPEPVKNVQIVSLATASWMSAERWDGELGENSGLGTIGGGLGLTWNITPKLALSGMLSFHFFERAQGAQFKQPLSGTLGISGFFGKPPAP